MQNEQIAPIPGGSDPAGGADRIKELKDWQDKANPLLCRMYRIMEDTPDWFTFSDLEKAMDAFEKKHFEKPEGGPGGSDIREALIRALDQIDRLADRLEDYGYKESEARGFLYKEHRALETAQPNKDRDGSAKRSAEASPQIREAVAALEKAHAEVCRVHDAFYTRKPDSWRITIPADERRDSDIIIGNALNMAHRLLSPLTSASESLSEAKGPKDSNTPVTGGAGAGDLEECPECHMTGPHKLQCSRRLRAPVAPKRDEA